VLAVRLPRWRRGAESESELEPPSQASLLTERLSLHQLSDASEDVSSATAGPHGVRTGGGEGIGGALASNVMDRCADELDDRADDFITGGGVQSA